MNLGNGKSPKHTGRSSTYVAPPTSLSTNFSKKLYHPRPAPLAENPAPHDPQSITNLEASGSNFPFPPPISPKPQMARMRKKVRGKFGENRGQDHCHRSQISKCFHSTNGRDLGHQHTGRGKIRQLKQTNRLRRIGPAKGGNWQVVT